MVVEDARRKVAEWVKPRWPVLHADGHPLSVTLPTLALHG
jgi:hypothetical protein